MSKLNYIWMLTKPVLEVNLVMLTKLNYILVFDVV
jgi:hypothetical protein